jgi:hypothetical protein
MKNVKAVVIALAVLTVGTSSLVLGFRSVGESESAAQDRSADAPAQRWRLAAGYGNPRWFHVVATALVHVSYR